MTLPPAAPWRIAVVGAVLIFAGLAMHTVAWATGSPLHRLADGIQHLGQLAAVVLVGVTLANGRRRGSQESNDHPDGLPRT